MTRQINIVVVPPGAEAARLVRVTPDLDTLSGLIGGPLQVIGLTEDSVMYLNEEGKWAGLPVNENANALTTLADVGLAPDDFVVGQVIVTGVLSPKGTLDGYDHDVPASVLDLCARAGVTVTDATRETAESPNPDPNPAPVD